MPEEETNIPRKRYQTKIMSRNERKGKKRETKFLYSCVYRLLNNSISILL